MRQKQIQEESNSIHQHQTSYSFNSIRFTEREEEEEDLCLNVSSIKKMRIAGEHQSFKQINNNKNAIEDEIISEWRRIYSTYVYSYDAAAAVLYTHCCYVVLFFFFISFSCITFYNGIRWKRKKKTKKRRNIKQLIVSYGL